jgi:uncharacterized membrane protein
MERPAHHWTSRVLTVGTLVAAMCLLVGLVLSLLGAVGTAGDPRRFDLLLGSILELRPWGWSMLGVLVLIATPAAGLVATFFELRADQPRAALLALAVLAILGVAALIAWR